ncbi:hypothetical protein PENSPDRAFT_752091 [Peniophora sp. CONT]|nr:hypothetical protein PENSPDRAFT_752091 [Peniophora sp. CONT]
MSTRRKVGVSTATTESARRQLMAPVACWERQLVKPDASANFKVYKWVKTDRPQNFDDDEGGVDEPLAPLPDEPEVIEDDEEAQDETAAATPAATPAAPEAISRAASESDLKPESNAESKAVSPKPHPLSMSFGPDDAAMQDSVDDGTGALGDETGVLGDASATLGAGDLDSGDVGVLDAGALDAGALDVDALEAGALDAGVLDAGALDAGALDAAALGDVGTLDGGLTMPLPASESAQLDAGAIPELNMSGLGPDGEPFEAAHELSQIQPEDALLGSGQVMDSTVSEDPFAMNTS